MPEPTWAVDCFEKSFISRSWIFDLGHNLPNPAVSASKTIGKLWDSSKHRHVHLDRTQRLLNRWLCSYTGSLSTLRACSRGLLKTITRVPAGSHFWRWRWRSWAKYPPGDVEHPTFDSEIRQLFITWKVFFPTDLFSLQGAILESAQIHQGISSRNPPPSR